MGVRAGLGARGRKGTWEGDQPLRAVPAGMGGAWNNSEHLPWANRTVGKDKSCRFRLGFKAGLCPSPSGLTSHRYLNLPESQFLHL